MRRLERDGLIRSQWEKQAIADDEQRPPRKYYRLTNKGREELRRLKSEWNAFASAMAKLLGQE